MTDTTARHLDIQQMYTKHTQYVTPHSWCRHRLAVGSQRMANKNTVPPKSSLLNAKNMANAIWLINN